MAKEKAGIKYYSQDSDHVLNTKIKLLFMEFDSHGPWVWECLKCAIYSRNGYYFDMNKDDELIIFASDVCKKPVSLVKEIINGCIRRGLFNKAVFDAFGVLTSDRIQYNYLDGNREKRKKGPGQINLIIEFLVIEIAENEKRINLISLKNPDYRETIENYREKLNNSREKIDKEKEIRLNKIKGEGKEKEKIFSPPLFDEVYSFFEDKIPDTFWDFSKCKKEAQAFIDYYQKTGWQTKNGPIIHWQNAASGWINFDNKIESGKPSKKRGSPHPDHWDAKYVNTLDGPGYSSYITHLHGLGLKPVKDRFDKVVDFKKPET